MSILPNAHARPTLSAVVTVSCVILFSVDVTQSDIRKKCIFLHVFQLCRLLGPAKMMAAILAAASHDVDHPGVNQTFLKATNNPLASLYTV